MHRGFEALLALVVSRHCFYMQSQVRMAFDLRQIDVLVAVLPICHGCHTGRGDRVMRACQGSLQTRSAAFMPELDSGEQSTLEDKLKMYRCSCIACFIFSVMHHAYAGGQKN